MHNLRRESEDLTIISTLYKMAYLCRVSHFFANNEKIFAYVQNFY